MCNPKGPNGTLSPPPHQRPPIKRISTVSRAVGVWVSQYEERGRDTPQTCTLEVRHPECKRSISAILVRCLLKTRQNACDTPSAIASRKGLARFGVGKIHAVFERGSAKKCASSFSQKILPNFVCQKKVENLARNSGGQKFRRPVIHVCLVWSCDEVETFFRRTET